MEERLPVVARDGPKARRGAAARSLRTSRYAFAIPVRRGVLLYSARTGAVVHLSGPDADAAAALVSGSERVVAPGALPPGLQRDLIAGGMLVAFEVDELAEIRQRYLDARREAPIALTITTTMDCNLGCYYCYEERSGAQLEASDTAPILAMVRERLARSGKRSLHVDWYGGEPLLNQPFLDGASTALQALCLELGVAFTASIISNGTSWPADVGAFVDRHRIRQAQISFDGMQANHDKRRHYRRGRAPAENASSFARAIAVVDALLFHTRVDVRFNIDRGNVKDLPAFLVLMRDRGWFERPFPVVVQPARLAAYSQRSSFMRQTELSADEFDAVRAQVRHAVGGEVGVEESEVPDGFPFPRTSVCAALAPDSVVVGAEGELYRCGLQVGEQGRSVASLPDVQVSPRRLPVIEAEGTDAAWWSRFDPTTQPKCARCSFLPICWSGCPKKHLEGDAHAIDEQGAYWRRNLPRLVADGVGLGLRSRGDLTLSDQFRDQLERDSRGSRPT